MDFTSKMQFRNERIERDIEKLVDVCKKVIPSLSEIRVFGSYNNGNWNPEKSDVDIFVETSDEEYSRYGDCENGVFPLFESKQRRKIRSKLVKEVYKAKQNGTKFSVHFYSQNDVVRLSIPEKHFGRGSLGINMKCGRLLCQNR